MTALGLTSRVIVNAWGQELRHAETLALISAARAHYDDVVLLNPNLLAISLPRDADRPAIVHDGVPLPPIDTLMIRSSKGLGPALTALVQGLRLQRTDVLDVPEEYDGEGGSKLSSSFERFSRGVGSTTHLAFSAPAALHLVQRLSTDGAFPLIAKPIRGKQGRGVIGLTEIDDAIRHVRDHFETSPEEPLLLQAREAFIAEYRVTVCLGASVGVARKQGGQGQVAANVAQGGTLERCDRPDVEAFAVQAVSDRSILGVDVGERADGSLVIIEANRAPNFVPLDSVLGFSVADRILARARERVGRPPT